MDFNREEIFQLIYEKKWTELIKIVHERGHEITNCGDEIIINAIQTFIKQFINEQKKGIKSDYIDQLHMIFSLHQTNIFELPEEDFKSIVLMLVGYYESNLEESVYYAKIFPDNEICADVIKRYESNLPQTIKHSQNHAINVAIKKSISNIDYTSSLFKSNQEKDFFFALCRVFPRNDVYPNVAVSCLFNYEKIKDELKCQEKDFFFRGIVDCVVFDREAYKPIYFFELDSKYHDELEQKIKDGYKDKIINTAGQKLYRIRKKQENIGISEFICLINEILDSN